MAIKHSPGCGCCGDCNVLEYSFYPDFYLPSDVRCYVRERVRTVTTVDGISTDTDVTTDFVDEKKIAGRWHWDYPETQTQNGDVTTKVKIDVWEERRLALQFDISDQFALGEVGPDDEPAVSSSHMRFWTRRYRRQDFSESVVFSSTNEAEVYGIYLAEPFPVDIAAYDSLVGSADNVDTIVGESSETDPQYQYIDVSEWLPDSTQTTALILIDQNASQSGIKIDEVKWAMAASASPAAEESNSGVDRLYDWRNDWTRTELGKYKKRIKRSDRDKRIDITPTIQSLLDNFEDVAQADNDFYTFPRSLTITLDAIDQSGANIDSKSVKFDLTLDESSHFISQVFVPFGTNRVDTRRVLSLSATADDETVYIGRTYSDDVNGVLQSRTVAITVSDSFLSVGSSTDGDLSVADFPLTDLKQDDREYFVNDPLPPEPELITQSQSLMFEGLSSSPFLDVTILVEPSYESLSTIGFSDLARTPEQETEKCPTRLCPSTVYPHPIDTSVVKYQSVAMPVARVDRNGCVTVTQGGDLNNFGIYHPFFYQYRKARWYAEFESFIRRGHVDPAPFQGAIASHVNASPSVVTFESGLHNAPATQRYWANIPNFYSGNFVTEITLYLPTYYYFPNPTGIYPMVPPFGVDEYGFENDTKPQPLLRIENPPYSCSSYIDELTSDEALSLQNDGANPANYIAVQSELNLLLPTPIGNDASESERFALSTRQTVRETFDDLRSTTGTASWIPTRSYGSTEVVRADLYEDVKHVLRYRKVLPHADVAGGLLSFSAADCLDSTDASLIWSKETILVETITGFSGFEPTESRSMIAHITDSISVADLSIDVAFF